MSQVTLEEAPSENPKCPHCSKDILTVLYKELTGGMLGKRYIYFCGSCRASLGVSHRKGFWMG